MADMGFLPQVEWILRRTDGRHQTLLFSATLDGVVARPDRPVPARPGPPRGRVDQVTVEEMTQRFLQVHEMDKVKVAAAIAGGAEPHARVHPHQARRRQARAAAVDAKGVNAARDPRRPAADAA